MTTLTWEGWNRKVVWSPRSGRVSHYIENREMIKSSHLVLLPSNQLELDMMRSKWISDNDLYAQISKSPRLHVTFLYSCIDSYDTLLKHLPKEPIKAKFGNLRLDPNGPYVWNMFDEESQNRIGKLMEEANDNPEICRSHKDYSGPNPSKDFQARIDGKLTPHITVVIARTESNSYKFENQKDFNMFYSRFFEFHGKLLFPKDKEVIFDKICLTVQYDNGNNTVSYFEL